MVELGGSMRLRSYGSLGWAMLLDARMIRRSSSLLGSAVAVTLVAPGCNAVEDAGDCAKLRSQGPCEDADPFGESQCIWLDVAIVEQGDECSDATTQGRCIGFSGTQQGCSTYECGAEASDEDLVLFHRAADDGVIEVLRSPLCGPMPSGDWEECSMSSPDACACGCELPE